MNKPLRLPLVILLTGIAAGLCGLALTLLLHYIQHLAFGYSTTRIISDESFLHGVTAALPERRLLVLLACGLVAGVGWWALFRFGRPLISIKKAVQQADPRMPMLSTCWHALLQIITVAMGSPLGREVAPRELGAACAGWCAHRFGLSAEQCRIMVACGAGAGLAAVYNVPLAGALFTLEVLLGSFSLNALIPAFFSSSIAALVVCVGLGNVSQYQLPAWPIHTVGAPLVLWALLSGPLFGLAAWGFSALTARARASAPRDWRIVPVALLNFACIGVLVMAFPQLPGNGKGAATLAFHAELSFSLAATLLILKTLVCASSLRAGSEGGLLTPALACGALLAILLGGLWNSAAPEVLAISSIAFGALAIVGAIAFLAASMQMPLTAVVLGFELTRIGHDFLFPVLLAVAGSVAAYQGLGRRLARHVA